jgi:hypothetical protein
MAIPQDVQHTNENSHQKVLCIKQERVRDRIPMSMEQRTRRQENYNRQVEWFPPA